MTRAAAVASALLIGACASDDGGPVSAYDRAAPIVVVTYNTGTTPGLRHDAAPDDGYTSAEAVISDTHYGNGLAWASAITAAQAFFAAVDADVVAFQEIFHADACATVDPAYHAGFVCDGWAPGDSTVAQQLLGSDYQVACHPGKPDKCAAVHARFGRFEGCDDAFCLEGLVGSSVPDCGRGARVAQGRIVQPDGGIVTLVNVHGTSGGGAGDIACRRAQVDQIFVDGGAGAPLADGAENLVMGDLNTDPGRLAGADASAARWNDFAGPGLPFAFHSAVGPDAPASYGNLVDIDHVISDAFAGACRHQGLGGSAPVWSGVYFDHHPVVCTLVR